MQRQNESGTKTVNGGASITLPSFLAVPRPNGSRALARTVEAVQSWLTDLDIPVHIHRFTLRPYHMEWLGLWLAVAGLLLPVAALARWGWAGLALALLIVAIPILETRFQRATLTALIRQESQNLAVHFPAPRPRQELVLCAHLDSKTELLDHAQRGVLLRLGRVAMGLAVLCGVLMAVEVLLPPGTAGRLLYLAAFQCALVVAAYGLAMGINLVGGRFSRRPSSGAVDNGAAVALLLALARKLHQRDLHLQHTDVTLLFTVGEEAQMQGALAYVGDRKDWPLPAGVFNLEVLGQSGGYQLWGQDGTALQRLPVNAALNDALAAAVEAIAGEPPRRSPLLNSDAFAFLQQGIPAATLGSYDAELEDRGLHSALDHPERVSPARLEEALAILRRLLDDLDQSPASARQLRMVKPGERGETEGRSTP